MRSGLTPGYLFPDPESAAYQKVEKKLHDILFCKWLVRVLVLNELQESDFKLLVGLYFADTTTDVQ